MKIVVFGCDNAGKSSVANQLAEYVEGTAIHTPGPVGKDGMKRFIEHNLSLPDKIIFDRLPVIEEEVYGNLLRDGSVFKDDPDYVKSVLDRIDLFVYCYPGLFTILNWGDRDQYPGVKENALEMINMYNKIAVDLKSKGYNVKEYNYRCDNYKELIK